MKKRHLSYVILAVIILLAGLLRAQTDPVSNDKANKPIGLSGPRIGATFLSSKFIETIKSKHDIDLNPLVAQFGWQFETRFFTVESGITGVTEWVFLIGGFEQEKFLPSLSWLIGFRTAEGFEFGAGPNISLSGTSFVIATGITLKSDEVNFPINLALAQSKSGARFSLLFGFNMR